MRREACGKKIGGVVNIKLVILPASAALAYHACGAALDSAILTRALMEKFAAISEFPQRL
jgi:hypothetical protein